MCKGTYSTSSRYDVRYMMGGTISSLNKQNENTKRMTTYNTYSGICLINILQVMKAHRHDEFDPSTAHWPFIVSISVHTNHVLEYLPKERKRLLKRSLIDLLEYLRFDKCRLMVMLDSSYYFDGDGVL